MSDQLFCDGDVNKLIIMMNHHFVSSITVNIAGCADPGEVDFAERSDNFGGPYHVYSRIIYTCYTGFTGGGTIICERNGQWTEMPVCTGTYNELRIQKHWGLVHLVVIYILLAHR